MKAKQPKLNIIETAGIALSFLGAIFLLATAVFSAPLPLGAVALGLGIIGAVMIEDDIVKDNSFSESIVANLSITLLLLGISAIVKGIGVQYGLVDAGDAETVASFYTSAGFFVGGLALTGIGSLFKEEM